MTLSSPEGQETRGLQPPPSWPPTISKPQTVTESSKPSLAIKPKKKKRTIIMRNRTIKRKKIIVILKIKETVMDSHWEFIG